MMTTKRLTWKDHARLAEHHLALGQDEIRLFDEPNDDYPWEFVTETSTGGTHQYNTAVSIQFTAPHPSGLTFSWSINTVPYGSTGLPLDTERMSLILARTPKGAQAGIRKVLRDSAFKIMEFAQEYQAQVDTYTNRARLLLDLAERT
jgi:hypothetical protein